MFYEKIPEIVDAIEWDESAEALETITAWLVGGGFKNITITKTYDLKGAVHKVMYENAKGHGGLLCLTGQYFVNSGGKLSVVGKTKFESTYRPLIK